MSRNFFVFSLIFVFALFSFEFFGLRQTFLNAENDYLLSNSVSVLEEFEIKKEKVGKIEQSKEIQLNDNLNLDNTILKNSLSASFEEEEKEWFWVSTTYRNGKVVKPKKEKHFSISFGEKVFTTQTGCSDFSGDFNTFKDRIFFENISLTNKKCKDIDEGEFKKVIDSVGKYYFTDLGELVLVFKDDSAVVLLK